MQEQSPESISDFTPSKQHIKSNKFQRIRKYKRVVMTLLLLVLVIGIPVSLYLVKLNQDNRNQAAVNRGPTSNKDLDLMYITRTPRYQVLEGDSDAPGEGEPRVGENIQFTAHVRNKGSEPINNFRYMWRINGETINEGTYSNSLQPNAIAQVQLASQWDGLNHVVNFIVDPNNDLQNEISEENNTLDVHTISAAMSLYVEQRVYDYMNQTQITFCEDKVCRGSNSFEDWAQNQIKKWNSLVKDAKYASSPLGPQSYWRLEKITVVPNGSLPDNPEHVPYPKDAEVDLHWGLTCDIINSVSFQGRTNCAERPNPPVGYYVDQPNDPDQIIDKGILHEKGHERGVNHSSDHTIPTYSVHVKDAQGNLITNTPKLPEVRAGNVYIPPSAGDIMDNGGVTMGEYASNMLGLGAGKRYIWDDVLALNLTQNNTLKIVSQQDIGVPNAEVAIFNRKQLFVSPKLKVSFRVGNDPVIEKTFESIDYQGTGFESCQTFQYNDPMVGKNSGNGNCAYTKTFIHFDDVDIPREAQIVSAALSFYTSGTYTAPITFNIQAENVGNSQRITQESPPSSRAMTTAFREVTNPPAWYFLKEETFDQINPVVQEVISRNDWRARNAMTIFLNAKAPSDGFRFMLKASDPQALIYDNVPDLVTTTNAYGVVNLGHNIIYPGRDPIAYYAPIIVRVKAAGQEQYKFLNASEYHFQYWQGQRERAGTTLGFNLSGTEQSPSSDAVSPLLTIANKTFEVAKVQQQFSAFAHDLESGVQKLELYIDGVLKDSKTMSAHCYTYCGIDSTINTSSLAAGNHTLRVKAFDKNNNQVQKEQQFYVPHRTPRPSPSPRPTPSPSPSIRPTPTPSGNPPPTQPPAAPHFDRMTSFSSDIYIDSYLRQFVINDGKIHRRTESAAGWTGWEDISYFVQNIGQGTITSFSSDLYQDGFLRQFLVRNGKIYRRTQGATAWTNWEDITYFAQDVGQGTFTSFTTGVYQDNYQRQFIVRGGKIYRRTQSAAGWTGWEDITYFIQGIGQGEITGFTSGKYRDNYLRQFLIRNKRTYRRTESAAGWSNWEDITSFFNP